MAASSAAQAKFLPRALTGSTKRLLTARPDSVDFRDRMYEPTLVEVPPVRPIEAVQALALPVLDQGSEGACTGFGLAAVWDPEIRAVAGFRPLEMFSTGPLLYVDDLVTAEKHRSEGYGEKLLKFLEEKAGTLGCRHLELDSGSERLAAHRFYRRHGLTEVALHFSKATGVGTHGKLA